LLVVWLFVMGSIILGIFNEEYLINPCPNGYPIEETKTIDNQLYYRCCKSSYEIKGNTFKENEDCQILKAKPSLWESWFGD